LGEWLTSARNLPRTENLRDYFSVFSPELAMDSFSLLGTVNEVEEDAFVFLDIAKEENLLSNDRPLARKPVLQGAIGKGLKFGKVK
jgi:hypothetical protein